MTFENLFIATAQAQETAAVAANPQGSTFGMFLPMIFVFVIFYFLLIRPQSKQRKKHQELLKGLKKGDEAVTASGIHGKVAGIADNVVTFEIAENVRIKIDKQQVAAIKAVSNG